MFTPSLPGEIIKKWHSDIINDIIIIGDTFLYMFWNPHI